MDSRREFLRKAAMLAGTAGMNGMIPESVQRAFAINPDAGTTFLDAEHVVILMQENRSFDHCFGSLRGVRGFNDPRALHMPGSNPVWLQRNGKGETFVPFRLNIHDTNATWMGSLPHSWTDQTDARNGGRHDRWLEAKKSGHADYAHMPLTLGYYTREDLPFYYALADAFTVCDQNFCSSLTGTTPNRLHLWTGKIREDASAQARVRNEETDYDAEAAWKTFPERLEENNVSWKVYQNDVSVGTGLAGEEDAWLSNFTDNPLEWFSQFQVRFVPAYWKNLPKRIEQVRAALAEIDVKIKTAEGEELARLKARRDQLTNVLATAQEDLKNYTPEKFAARSSREKELHRRAFTTNTADTDYHTLTTLTYRDGSIDREMKVPKGDVLHQFRQDVKNGTLPTVSWLVAPENFSDHPGAPWYGAWYLSEALDILTQNPAVWKKTIFILCYDENDGYFDHVPPFVPPTPGKPNTGKVSAGIDVAFEHVSLEQDLQRKPSRSARGGPIGLGYRVPLVIASPWSRGGAVCSEVFDHTSILQFLEKFVNHKTGKAIQETNISAWRRTVCGDLTAVFTPYNGEAIATPAALSRDAFVESIHKAQFRQVPSGFHALTAEEIAQANRGASSILPAQEKGTRTARPLPYELYADGQLTDDKRSFQLTLTASNAVFGDHASGAPFCVYNGTDQGDIRHYAVKAGDTLTDSWSELREGRYHVMLYGPNGFFRVFRGSANDPLLAVSCTYPKVKGSLTGNIELTMINRSNATLNVTVKDNAYKQKDQLKTIGPGATMSLVVSLAKSSGWYDASVLLREADAFEARFAGKVETGKEGITDPAMGREV